MLLAFEVVFIPVILQIAPIGDRLVRVGGASRWGAKGGLRQLFGIK